MMRAILFILVSVCILTACQETDQTAISSDTVLAQYSGGQVTLADVDSFLLHQSDRHLWRSDQQTSEWISDVITRMVTDRLLAQEAELVAVSEDPQFKTKSRQIERNAYSDFYLQQQPVDKSLQINEQKLKAYFEENQSNYQFEEQRNVFNIYQSFSAGESPQSVKTAMEALRQRHINGESFQLLAEQNSESESRHREGSIGSIRRGQLSEDFDSIIFSMDARSISEVIQTINGMHLFYVGDVLQAQSNEFDDVRALVFNEMRASQIMEQLRQTSADLPQPELYELPDKNTFYELMRQQPAQTVVLAVGDFSLNKAQFNAHLIEVSRQLGAKQIDDLAYRLLQEIAYRERIYQHVRQSELPEAMDQQLGRERQSQLVDHYLQSKLKAYLAQNPEPLRRHYDNNQMRFASALSVRLERLLVPLSNKPAKRMARLEQVRPELDDQTISLQQLSDELNGETRTTGFIDAARLRSLDPTAARFAFVLKLGQHSPPYRIPGFLTLVKVLERKEPELQPLVLVRERVVEDYLRNYAADVYAALSQQLLQEHEFELATDILPAAIKAIALPGLN